MGEGGVKRFSLAPENHFLLFYIPPSIIYTHPDKVWPFSVAPLLLCVV